MTRPGCLKSGVGFYAEGSLDAERNIAAYQWKAFALDPERTQLHRIRVLFSRRISYQIRVCLSNGTVHDGLVCQKCRYRS